MDLTEAAHTQTLIDWLTNPHQVTAAQADAARDAAAWLADRAHHVNHARPTAAQVLLGWDNLLQGCSGCGDCTPDPNDQADGDDQDDDHQDEDLGGVEGWPPAELSDDEVRRLVADGWPAPVGPVDSGPLTTGPGALAVAGADTHSPVWTGPTGQDDADSGRRGSGAGGAGASGGP